MKMQPFLLATLALPVAFSADVAPTPGHPGTEKVEVKLNRSVLDFLKEDGRYKILVSALTTTDMDKTLETVTPSTFFAPTDEAFQRVPKLAELLADEAHLKTVLNRHLITQRRLDTAMLRSESVLVPMQGEKLNVSSEKGVHINDAKIVHPNNDTRTAMVHGIDHVLMANNDSILRDVGTTVEDGVKTGAKKVHEGLKKGAEKVKDALD